MQLALLGNCISVIERDYLGRITDKNNILERTLRDLIAILERTLGDLIAR